MAESSFDRCAMHEAAADALVPSLLLETNPRLCESEAVSREVYRRDAIDSHPGSDYLFR